MDMELYEILDHYERETLGEAYEGLVEALESRTELERWISE